MEMEIEKKATKQSKKATTEESSESSESVEQQQHDKKPSKKSSKKSTPVKESKKAKHAAKGDEKKKSKKKKSDTPSKKKEIKDSDDDDGEEETAAVSAEEGSAKKKRKAPSTASDKEKSSDPSSVENVALDIKKLGIAFDMEQLAKMKRKHPKDYETLINMLRGKKTKGLVYAFNTKTPLGRMFYYYRPDREFKNVRASYNLVKLVKHHKEKELNIAAYQSEMSEKQRKTAFDAMGVASLVEASTLSPAKWLYGLVETNIIEKQQDQPLSTQPAESILYHDHVNRETHWLCSTSGKPIFSQVILTRTRTVTENNINNELLALKNKRKDISHFLDKHDCVRSSHVVMSDGSLKNRPSDIVASKPKKKKSSKKHDELKPEKAKKKSTASPRKKKSSNDTMEVEKPKKPQKPMAAALLEKAAFLPPEQQSLLKEILAASSSSSSSSEVEEKVKVADKSSGSSSTSSSSSSCEESEEAQPPTKKRKLSEAPKATTPPVVNPVLTMKQKIEEVRQNKKLIDECMDPEIRDFRTMCS